MKSIQALITEGNHKFYSEDFNNMENEDDVIEAILEALKFSGIYDSFCNSIENSLDPHIFTDNKFLKKFGDQLSEAVNEYYDEEF